MLSPELIKKIRRIHIRSARAVDTLLAGQYRSVFRGSGVEFEEVREYQPGDEVKSIDWQVTARLGRPFVKLYREERELTIMLLVDLSGSTEFGTIDSLKREKATEFAAVLAFNAIRNNDRVGAILFTDQVERYVPPKKGSAHVWRVIKEIVSHEPRSRGTDLGAAADFLSKVCRKKAVAFFISDFLCTDYLSSLRHAGRRHDCIAVAVTDPGDRSLPQAGILEIEDLETGARAWVDCSDPATRRVWETMQRQRQEQTFEGLKRAGIDAVELPGTGSAVDVLRGFFRARERRLR